MGQSTSPSPFRFRPLEMAITAFGQVGIDLAAVTEELGSRTSKDGDFSLGPYNPHYPINRSTKHFKFKLRDMPPAPPKRDFDLHFLKPRG